MKTKNPELRERFENLEIDPAAFGHRQHVRIAFELRRRYGFLDACTRFVNTIECMANDALDKWYSRQDLSSEFARTHFMLPRHAA